MERKIGCNCAGHASQRYDRYYSYADTFGVYIQSDMRRASTLAEFLRIRRIAVCVSHRIVLPVCIVRLGFRPSFFCDT